MKMPGMAWDWMRAAPRDLRPCLPLLFALLLNAVAPQATAHTRSESLAQWVVDGSEVSVTVTLPEVEAQRLRAADGLPPSDAQVAAYLARHLGAEAAGRACKAAGRPATPAATHGFRRVELQWHCDSAQHLVLHSSAFYELVPTHVMLARVTVRQPGQERTTEQLLNEDRRLITLDDAQGHDLQSASFAEYIGMGMLHIVTGPDHIAFLLGLVLISARWRDLALVVTGFTLGHSATLALAVTGWLRPAPELIDVLIALTIGLVGAENVAVVSRRVGLIALATGTLLLAMAAARLAGLGRVPLTVLMGAALFAPCYLLMAARLADAAPVRAAVTAVFGLVHGFAFANDLIELRLPRARLAELLFGFNIGVELGQLVIVSLMLGAAALLVRARWALPRRPVVELSSAGLVGLSVFWIVGRTYAP
jgi:hypothetical protein